MFVSKILHHENCLSIGCSSAASVGSAGFSGHGGPVAQRITRLTTDQKIAGSNPAWIEKYFLVFVGKFTFHFLE